MTRCPNCGETEEHSSTCYKNPNVVIMGKDDLKRYCDQARAYGFEVGRIRTLEQREVTVEAVYQSTPLNPFIEPNWDAHLNLPQGFLLTSKDNPL